MNKFDVYTENAMKWIKGLSERTLALSSISIFHLVFLPNVIAYMNGLTDKLPTLDSYLLVVAGLVIMNLRAIIKKDSLSMVIHLIGFISQLAVLAIVLMK